MHISEGVLSNPVLAGGAVLTLIGTSIGLKKFDYDKLMGVAILSAVFFVATLIHVPVGPASAHLIMNGLLGLILGWAAFPAILVGLTLQAVLFQYGGITALGVNAFNMAAPAVVCHYLFGPMVCRDSGKRLLGAFLCGAGSILLTGLLTASSLALSGDAFMAMAKTIVVAHVPIMVVEGFVVAFSVSFLCKVRPEALGFSLHK